MPSPDFAFIYVDFKYITNSQVRLQTSNAFKGTFDCTIKTMQKEGAKGFFKGMSFPLASVAAYNAIVFGVYR